MDVKGRGFLDTYFLTTPDAGCKSLRPKRDSTSRTRKIRHSVGDLQSSFNLDAVTFPNGIPEDSSEYPLGHSDASLTTRHSAVTNKTPTSAAASSTEVSTSSKPASDKQGDKQTSGKDS